LRFSLKVSIIVLTYNRAHLVTETIDSILAQTVKDFELIVVDNESTDNTEEVIKSYTDRRIRYFRHQNNGLVAVNRNYGISKANGEYIAFCDDDDLWMPEKLERQVNLLDLNKELGLVYSDCYIMDENGNLERDTLLSSSRLLRGNVFDKLFQGNFIPMLTVMFRREVLSKVGGFDPKYRIAQDYDLWLRIAEHYPIDFIEKPLAKYRIHGGNVSRNRELAINEGFQLTEYWLEKKANLERGFRGKAKQKQANLHISLMVYYFRNHQNRKAVSESINIIKLFPYSLVLVPMVIAKLRRVLNSRRNSCSRM
jgi:glycosyltransferase involved in cell wall biosynthesis